jgi:hypothetical protein
VFLGLLQARTARTTTTLLVYGEVLRSTLKNPGRAKTTANEPKNGRIERRVGATRARCTEASSVCCRAGMEALGPHAAMAFAQSSGRHACGTNNPSMLRQRETMGALMQLAHA